MWFENLVGFKEESHKQVRNNLIVEKEYLISKINGKRYQYGQLEVPTLGELRQYALQKKTYQQTISVSEIVGNVEYLHQKAENKGAMFQAASQFNLLEMTNPYVTPEEGIGIYEYDRTQGPACAIACGAGTIYRNYFAKVGNQIGQTSVLQIDCLDEIGETLQNQKWHLWEMKNGYALVNLKGLEKITTHIKSLSEKDYEKLKEKLKIGLQWNTAVTISEHKQIVSQAYCSALPVAYSEISTIHWAAFAKMILEATYEATFWAALKNYEQTGSNKLFLTLVGGGVFGNEISWILNAIEKAIFKFQNTALDVKIVSYGRSNFYVRNFVQKIQQVL